MTANYSHEHWLLRAAEMLEEEAQTLKDCHTVGGEWDGTDTEVQENCAEMLSAAAEVRIAYQRSVSNQ
jgi:hypothetical protein